MSGAGKFKFVPSAMADEILYHFSDEEDGEDALLDRAFDRWEQLGGGSARSPLFQFTMQPIGRRRCWRDVVEWVQFNAQLRQLRDPVAGDNIGMALTLTDAYITPSRLNSNESSDLLIILSVLPSRLMRPPTPTKRRILPWASFCNGQTRLDEMLATLVGKLSSNESFNPDRGFQVNVVFVSMPGPGSGRG